jgi:ferredoxin
MRDVKKVGSYPVNIFIAGDVNYAKNICQKYCIEVGLCVTVTPTDYIYSGGRESGMVIGLINYPRFPAEKEDIFRKAEGLGLLLVEKLGQWSFTIESPTETVFYSNKPKLSENFYSPGECKKAKITIEVE